MFGRVGINMATSLVSQLRLVIYSLLVVTHESHLGTLPGLFIDQAVGCDHDHGPAPSFSAPENGSIVTGHHGAPAQLPCAVHELNHRAVSWVRKTMDDLQLLTVGESSHTADPRIDAEFIYPHLWLLKFNPATVNDSGVYLCHVSTDPPLIRYVHLEISVPEPIVELIDTQTDTALSPDRVLYYRIGSSLELRCRVQRYWVKPMRFHWLKAGKPVSEELWRGGISIYTETTKPGQLDSKLSIANATINDGGNYTCNLDSFSVSIIVHFLKEEKQAASQHASNCGIPSLMLPSIRHELARPLLIPLLLLGCHHVAFHHRFRVIGL